MKTSDDAHSMARLLDRYAVQFDNLIAQTDVHAHSKLDASFSALWAEQRSAWPVLSHQIIVLGLANCDVVNALDIVTTSGADTERLETPYLRDVLNAHAGALSAVRGQLYRAAGATAPKRKFSALAPPHPRVFA